MDEILKDELQENEKLLWTGKPENFEVLDKTNKKQFVTKTTVASVIAVGLITAYALLAAGTGEFKWGLVALVLIFAAIGPLNVLGDANKLKKQVSYAITDQRLITILDGTKSLSYPAVGCAEFRTDADGHTTLLCGPAAIKSGAAKWRTLAVTGVRMDDSGGKCESYAMYALPDAERVKEILKPYISIE